MNQDLWDRLKEADPAAGVSIGTGDADEVLRRAANDITSYDDVVPGRRRMPLLVAAGLVFVVAGTAAAVLLRDPGDGQPAVPPPSIAPDTSGPAGRRDCLTHLANRLQPAPYDGTPGKYAYIKTSTTSGDTTEMPGGGMARATWREQQELWLAADGSGRLRTERDQPVYADKTSETFYKGHPGMLPSAVVRTKDLAPGEYSLPAAPAADPAAMAEVLYVPRENGPWQALAGVGDINMLRIFDPAHRAALLRFLAATDGVSCGPEATAEGGRTGVRVTATLGKGPAPTPGDHGVRMLLFDTRTGELLESGQGPSPDATFDSETHYLDRRFTDLLG